jgi:hypothetical protein
MARKYGINNKMSTHFADYDYIINGVGGIGKTTMVYEIGKKITGSDEGTFVINFGEDQSQTILTEYFMIKQILLQILEQSLKNFVLTEKNIVRQSLLLLTR